MKRQLRSAPGESRTRRRVALLLSAMAAIQTIIAYTHAHGGVRILVVMVSIVGAFAALRVVRGSIAEARGQLGRRIHSGEVRWSKRLTRYLEKNPLSGDKHDERVLAELPAHAVSMLTVGFFLGTAVLWLLWALFGTVTVLAYVLAPLGPHRGLITLAFIASTAGWFALARWHRRNHTVVSTTGRIIVFQGKRREPIVISRQDVRDAMPGEYPATRILSSLRIMALPTGKLWIKVGDAGGLQELSHVTDPKSVVWLFMNAAQAPQPE